jgi:hypothetical protein
MGQKWGKSKRSLVKGGDTEVWSSFDDSEDGDDSEAQRPTSKEKQKQQWGEKQ